jgi:membrane protein
VLQAATEANVPFLASALTFDALMAAIPLLLILLAALGAILQATLGPTPVGLAVLFQRFFPAQPGSPDRDTFGAIQALLEKILDFGWAFPVVMIPVFLLTGSRLFSGIRTSLSWVYDTSARPERGHWLVSWLRAKGRDLSMLLLTALLLALSVALTTGLDVLQAWSAEEVPALAFFLTGLGQWLGELVALLFLIVLFYNLYRWASPRRVTRRAALLAAGFSAVGFEIAKRLFGVYVAYFLGEARMSFDANVGALLLFILWMYYTALVFLLGGIVAETWELRTLQHQQRTRFGGR